MDNKQYHHDYYIKNKERMLEQIHSNYRKNREARIKQKIEYMKNSEKIKLYRESEDYKKIKYKSWKRWKAKNLEHFLAWQREYSRKRYKEKMKKFGYYRHSYTKFRKNLCENCSNTLDLLVHHLDENRKNNNKENLITLCRGCHSKLHNTKCRELH